MERAETTNTTGNRYQVSLVETLCQSGQDRGLEPGEARGRRGRGGAQARSGGGLSGSEAPGGRQDFRSGGREKGSPRRAHRCVVRMLRGGCGRPGVFSACSGGTCEGWSAPSVQCLGVLAWGLVSTLPSVYVFAYLLLTAF